MKHYDVDPLKLSEVFDKKSSTYKFYWMLALLDIVREGRTNEKVTFTEMVARMISKAWAPLTVGMFSFGKCDKLSSRIQLLIFTTELKYCDTEERVKNYIEEHGEQPAISKITEQMTKYVPFRFLYPWLGYDVKNKPVELASQDFSANRCPYCIEGKSIRINPAWVEYLSDHVDIIEGFARHNLTYYLMNYNENIILPEEMSLSVTADGLSTSFNLQMGLVSEPLNLSYDKNAEIASLKKQLKSEQKQKNALMKLLGKTGNVMHFQSGSQNSIFTGN